MNLQGLFGYVDGGLVQNVGLEGGSITGRSKVGGVVGYNCNGTVQNCYNTGAVSDSANYVGGVVGYNYKNSTVQNCYNTGAVSGNKYVGGVVGYNYGGGTVKNCYNTGAVSGGSYFGSVAGVNSVTITNCYYNKDNCSVGGIKGTDVADSATGLTTVQMTGENCMSNFAGFTSTEWTTKANGVPVGDKMIIYYPQLKAFGDTNVAVKLHNFGTESAPDWQRYIEIDSVEKLQAINDKLSGNYILTADIDFTDAAKDESGSNFTAIGTDTTPFTGKFDGCGHKITGLVINKPDVNLQGLFGYVYGGLVQNVGLEGGSITGRGSVGGVVGNNYNGTVTNCYNTGTVSGSADYVGGVVAYNGNNSTVTNCYNTGTVSGNKCVGGVVGYNYKNRTVKNCYNTGAVSGIKVVGGVVGSNGGFVTNCYNTGAVSGTSDKIGGVVGYNYNNTVTNCYNTGAVSGNSEVGGVVGHNLNGTVTNCYYNKDNCSVGGINSADVADSATGLTTAEMTGECSAMTGFDFKDIWATKQDSETDSNNCKTIYYPQLAVFGDTNNVAGKLHNFGTESATDWQGYIEIDTVEKLQAINDNLSGNYILTADIDFTEVAKDESGSNFTAIGASRFPFTGKFDGCGHKITGLVINKPDVDYQGLFGFVSSGGLVQNVGLEGGSITGNDCAGGVVASNRGTVQNCYNTGAVSGNENIGGVAGFTGTSTVTNCYNTGAVSGNSKVGGVVGYNYNITVENCYNTGAVSGDKYVGGAVGYNYDGTITNCYYNKDNCSVGGINGGDVTNSATGLTTVQMIGENCMSNFAGFTEGDWIVKANGVPVGDKMTAYYPQLAVFGDTNVAVKLHNFGTESAPDWQGYIEIDTVEELQAIKNNLSGNYILTTDITLTEPNEGESNFTAIGNNTTPFTGKFDGCGHKITGLVINKLNVNYQGLFGYVDGGLVQNVGLEGGNITGNNEVGGVVGYIYNGTVTNCYNTGVVGGNNGVGGVAGDNNNGTVKNCYNTGAVSGNSAVGGVAGYNYKGTVTNCYNTGAVRGNSKVGGVAGYITGTVTNCYNTGAVSGNSEVGGVVGYNWTGTVENCYNTGAVSGSSEVGGVLGHNDSGTITNCYYNKDNCSVGGIDSADVADSATGLTTAQMTDGNWATTMANFSTDIWAKKTNAALNLIDESFGTQTSYYPYLKVFGETTSTSVNINMYYFTYTKGDAEIKEWLPYTEIDSVEKLQAIKDNLSANYILTADIDFTGVAKDESGSNFTAIGTGSFPFTGKFDGCGHKITGLVINSSAGCQGLFGCVGSGGLVQNVGLEGGSITGAADVGGVAGYNNTGTVQNCYNTAAVSGNERVGGVVGYNFISTVQNCYSTGAVSGNDYVGGVVGSNVDGKVKYCYNTGTVSVNNKVGGVAGNNSGTITTCYYNKDNCSVGGINGADAADSATGLTTVQMTGENCMSNFAGFTSTNWITKANKDPVGDKMTAYYPQLAVFGDTNVAVKLHNFGTETTPDWQEYIEIDTVEELQAIKDNLSANYILTENITFTAPNEGESNFTAIGTDTTPFTGKFDGCGHKITGLVINKPDVDYQGLFGDVSSGGLVQNVGLEGGSITGKNCVGGVVGDNMGSVQNCYNTGAVKGDNSGGVVGSNYGTVQNCYNAGAVSGNDYVGGVVGSNVDGKVKYCYNTGAVVSENMNVGGVAGSDSGTITTCYYNTDTCSVGGIMANDIAGMATGLTTVEMTGGDCSNMWGFNFADIWATKQDGETDSNNSKTAYYPQLVVFGATNVAVKLHNFGTETTPDWQQYTEIDTVEELQAIKDNLNANYILTANITFEAPAEGESNFTALGDNNLQFKGKFDGCGHKITGLVINKPDTYFQGLFGFVDGGLVQNVGLEGGSITGNEYVGGVVGRNDGGTLHNCYNTSTVSGISIVGGVVGYNNHNSTALNCYNTGAVSGTSYNIGGVVGYNNDNSTVQNCYNTGAVSGNESVGGVVGYNYCTVTNCYNTGVVSGNKSVGGVAGYNTGTITNCYNTGAVSGNENVGGVVGDYWDLTVQNCYYNKDNCSVGGIDGADAADSATGLTTAEMTGNCSGMTGFDFTSIWATKQDSETDSNNCKTAYYPQLKAFGDTNVAVKLHNFGTETTPDWQGYIEIDTVEKLQAIKDKLNSNYILTADIDFTNEAEDESGSNFTAIGTDIFPFRGKFDGCGHKITGLVINKPDVNLQGLFGYVYGGLVQNVGLEGGSITGRSNVGGVVGNNSSSGTVTNCYNTGTVSGSANYVGGVVGYNYKNSTVRNCYNTGVVSGNKCVGGVVGYNYNDSTVTNCYNTGVVGGNYGVGGVAGDNNNGTVKNCYNTGAVSGSADVGGVAGYNTGTITNCYYNKDNCSVGGINSADVADSATGLTTAEMTGECSAMTGFDFKDIWATKQDSATDSNNCKTAYYPQLAVFGDTNVAVKLHNFGTETTPDWQEYIEIDTVEELQAIKDNLSANYILTANITFTAPADGESNFTALGTLNSPFKGKFDGCGHKITGLVINKPDVILQGLFGYVDGGLVQNVGLEGGSITGNNEVGGVVGYNWNGTVENCYNTGAVSGTSDTVGGIVGYNNGGTVQNCYNTGLVSGSGVVGGVAGTNYSGTVKNCYNTGAVNGEIQVGGVVGYNGGAIQNCYNTGAVSGSSGVGGVVGYNIKKVESCYNTGIVSGNEYVGGVVGYNFDKITNCFYTGAAKGCGSEADAVGKVMPFVTLTISENQILSNITSVDYTVTENYDQSLTGIDKMGAGFTVDVSVKTSDKTIADLLNGKILGIKAGTCDIIADVNITQNALTKDGWTGTINAIKSSNKANISVLAQVAVGKLTAPDKILAGDKLTLTEPTIDKFEFEIAEQGWQIKLSDQENYTDFSADTVLDSSYDGALLRYTASYEFLEKTYYSYSDAVEITVNKCSPKLTLSGEVDENGVLTLKADFADGYNISGVVSFMQGANECKISDISKDSASALITGFTGDTSFTAVYDGDENNESATSKIFKINITFSAKKDTHYTTTSNDFTSENFEVKGLTNYKLSLTNTGNSVWSDTLTFKGETSNGIAKFYVKNTVTGTISTITAENYKIDKTLPTISGVVDKATYYVDQIVTATDANLDKLTVNGTEIKSGDKLAGDTAKTYTIVATDKAGNSKTVVVYMKTIDDVVNSIADITTENVQQDDKESIEKVLAALKKIGLTTASDGQKQEVLNDIKLCNDLLDIIEELKTQTTTETTPETTAETVTETTTETTPETTPETTAETVTETTTEITPETTAETVTETTTEITPETTAETVTETTTETTPETTAETVTETTTEITPETTAETVTETTTEITPETTAETVTETTTETTPETTAETVTETTTETTPETTAETVTETTTEITPETTAETVTETTTETTPETTAETEPETTVDTTTETSVGSHSDDNNDLINDIKCEIDRYNDENLRTDDKEKILHIIQNIDYVLDTENLTNGQKKTLEYNLAKAESLITTIDQVLEVEDLIRNLSGNIADIDISQLYNAKDKYNALSGAQKKMLDQVLAEKLNTLLSAMGDSNSDVPQTGYNAPFAACGALAVISFAAVVALRKRKK